MKFNIYIDESGTNKLNLHSTVAFSYVKILEQEEFDQKFIEIEKNLKIKPFHWVDNSWSIREKFLNEVIKLDFVCKIMISRNPVLPDKQMEKAIKYLLIEKNIGNIYIDGGKSKKYLSKIKNIVRSKGITTKKIDGVNDQQYPGIRLADLCAGIVRSYMDNKDEKSEKLFKKLRSKIEIILEDMDEY